jgi:hypothetical protein
VLDRAFQHQATEIAVSAEMIETVVMDTHVCQVSPHMLDGSLSSQLQEMGIRFRIKLKQGRAKVEA